MCIRDSSSAIAGSQVGVSLTKPELQCGPELVDGDTIRPVQCEIPLVSPGVWQPPSHLPEPRFGAGEPPMHQADIGRTANSGEILVVHLSAGDELTREERHSSLMV